MIRKKTEVISAQDQIKELEQVDFSPLERKDASFAEYGYIHGFESVVDSLKHKPRRQFFAGVLAGIWIGFAYTAAAVGMYTINNPSVEKLILAAMFSGVIIMIIFLGGGFVTAYMYLNYPMFKGVQPWKVYMKSCGSVYAGNAVGILFFVLLFQASNSFAGNEHLAEYVAKTFGYGKMSLVGDSLLPVYTTLPEAEVSTVQISFGTVMKSIGFIFASGIICNFMVCLATQGAKSSKGNVGVSAFIYILVLFYFAIGGYQHCVANWYGAWFLITSSWFGIAQVGAADGWIYVGVNIIPAILGNWVGALIIGYFLAMYNKADHDLLVKKYKLEQLIEKNK